MYLLEDFYEVCALKWPAAGKSKTLFGVSSQMEPNAFLSSDLLAFIEAIRVVYTATPAHDHVLRDSVVDSILQRICMRCFRSRSVEKL